MIHAGTGVLGLLCRFRRSFRRRGGRGDVRPLAAEHARPIPRQLETRCRASSTLNTDIQKLLQGEHEDRRTMSRGTSTRCEGAAKAKLESLKTIDSSVQTCACTSMVTSRRRRSRRGATPPTFFQGLLSDLLDEAQTAIWNNLQNLRRHELRRDLGLMIRCLAFRLSVQKQSIQLRRHVGGALPAAESHGLLRPRGAHVARADRPAS